MHIDVKILKQDIVKWSTKYKTEKSHPVLQNLVDCKDAGLVQHQNIN